MKFTRDVIYDLLAGYFAGEVSRDTRALIDEFLTTDPEFARMTLRFQRLFAGRAADTGDRSGGAENARTPRSRAERRQISAAFAGAYSFAAVFPLVMDMLGGQLSQAKSLFISIVFATVAIASTIGWLASRRSAIEWRGLLRTRRVLRRGRSPKQHPRPTARCRTARRASAARHACYPRKNLYAGLSYSGVQG